MWIVLVIVVGIILSLWLYWKLWFCRLPARVVPRKGIVAPANGKIAVIRKVKKQARAKKWNGGSVDILCKDVATECHFILIVMTPLNVHVQRAPAAGTILSTKYTEGKFVNAVTNAEKLIALENERNEILIKGKQKYKIVQIAGFLARRISCYVAKGEKVDKGEPLGFINVGSQVAVVLPASVKLRVHQGMQVIDGETVLGEWQ